MSDERVKLTHREIEVAIAIGDGLTYPEISKQLNLGYETVRSYVSQIRDKTGLRRKVQLALWSIRHRVMLERQLEEMIKHGK